MRPPRRPWRVRWRIASTMHSVSCRNSHRTPSAFGRCTRQWPRSAGSTCSACTATFTWGRPCAPRTGGASSTSRASRGARSRSARSPIHPGAMSPGCCAPSTTCPARWPSLRRRRRGPIRMPKTICAPISLVSGRVGRGGISSTPTSARSAVPSRSGRMPRRRGGGADPRRQSHAARRIRRRQGRVRGRLREAQPPRVDRDPARRARRRGLTTRFDGSAPVDQDAESTESTLPAGSLNQAMSGPRSGPPRMIPLASVPISSS